MDTRLSHITALLPKFRIFEKHAGLVASLTYDGQTVEEPVDERAYNWAETDYHKAIVRSLLDGLELGKATVAAEILAGNAKDVVAFIRGTTDRTVLDSLRREELAGKNRKTILDLLT
jgi:hypothetical protein